VNKQIPVSGQWAVQEFALATGKSSDLDFQDLDLPTSPNASSETVNIPEKIKPPLVNAPAELNGRSINAAPVTRAKKVVRPNMV
jgi:hypothetical protein